MPTHTTSRVVIVGAGAVGCATARELASDHDVLVLDSTGIASEASGLAAGLTAPTLFAFETPAVAERANRYLEDFSGTGEFVYHQRSRFEFARPAGEAAARERAERMADYGFPVEYVPAEAVQERHPRFDLDGFAGAVEIGDAGYVDDTYVYTRALARDAERMGAEFTTAEVVGPVVEDGEVTGVETTEGRVDAAVAVFAAGWRTADLVSDVASVPVRPFLLQAASVDPNGALGDGFPLGRLPAEAVYFRPQRNGRLRLGGGERLLDDPLSHTAGVTDAEETEARMRRTGDTAQEAVADGVDPAFADRIREAVPLFVDGFDAADDVRIEAGWCGVDGATADGEPVIDAPETAPDGLIVATGFNGLGITKSPVAALHVRSLVTGEPSPFPAEKFALDRLPETREFDLTDTFAMGSES